MTRTPLVTVIIPTRPGQADVPAVTSVRALEYPRECIEIIVVRGRQPAVQRNAALHAAKGELIYFLDDDALPNPENLNRATQHFSDPEVKMLGGPNVCPPSAPFLERVFAVVLGSWIAFGPSRARYEPVGTVRSSNEKELILCNLMARREAMLEAGGFDGALYPNEENALMDEMQKRGAKLLYDPRFIAHRRPRPTLPAFCRMLFTYGRGRAEQFRLHPTRRSALNFVPALFCLYAASLVVAFVLTVARVIPVWSLLGGVPLVVYAMAVAGQTLVSMVRHGIVRSMIAMPLFVASHLFYGMGFWRGLMTRLKKPGDKPTTEVTLDHVPAHAPSSH